MIDLVSMLNGTFSQWTGDNVDWDGKVKLHGMGAIVSTTGGQQVDLGLPMQIVRWIACFLENRQARVRYAGATSRSEIFKQGLPQGSVLSPLLFIIYINNLAAILPKSAIISMFADDVGILVTDRVAAKATKAAQKIVNVVVKWSREWRLTLNATKSEVAFFTKGKDGS